MVGPTTGGSLPSEYGPVVARGYVGEMLARRPLSPDFLLWDKKWGAPFGRRIVPGLTTVARKVGVDRRLAPLFGPFAYQSNSSTRAFEFPWAFQAVQPAPGVRVLEIGGALSGFQFVLSRAGCEVHNVDPFLDYGVGDYKAGPEERLAQLNRALKTNVHLHKSTLPEANVEGTFDVICSVSTIEHVPQDVLTETLDTIPRLLKPSGRVVLTVDLFLNLEPFCRRKTNQWGTNVKPKWIADALNMNLVEGDPSELLGYKEFQRKESSSTWRITRSTTIIRRWLNLWFSGTSGQSHLSLTTNISNLDPLKRLRHDLTVIDRTYNVVTGRSGYPNETINVSLFREHVWAVDAHYRICADETQEASGRFLGHVSALDADNRFSVGETRSPDPLPPSLQYAGERKR